MAPNSNESHNQGMMHKFSAAKFQVLRMSVYRRLNDLILTRIPYVYMDTVRQADG